MVQNSLNVEFLHTVRDVLSDESMADFREVLDIESIVNINDFSIGTRFYDSELIKLLEKKKMVYTVENGTLIIYVAHPSYAKSKIKPLKDFTSLYLSLVKFRIIDEIFLLKGRVSDSAEVSLSVDRDFFTDILRDFVIGVWAASFGSLPDVSENDYEVIYSFCPGAPCEPNEHDGGESYQEQ